MGTFFIVILVLAVLALGISLVLTRSLIPQLEDSINKLSAQKEYLSIDIVEQRELISTLKNKNTIASIDYSDLKKKANDEIAELTKSKESLSKAAKKEQFRAHKYLVFLSMIVNNPIGLLRLKDEYLQGKSLRLTEIDGRYEAFLYQGNKPLINDFVFILPIGSTLKVVEDSCDFLDLEKLIEITQTVETSI